MEPIEIIVIIACVLIVGGVIFKAVYDKKKGKTSCGCDCSKCYGCSACKESQKDKDNTRKL